VGSRPHWPPLAPLIAWVKLRGMQGLRRRATSQQKWVRDRIRELGTRRSTPVDAAEEVARAIQRSIAKRGTRPRWYMRQSLPGIHAALDAAMKKLIPKGLT